MQDFAREKCKFFFNFAAYLLILPAENAKISSISRAMSQKCLRLNGPSGVLNRKKDRDTSIVPLPFALSPQADKLFLHQELHYHFSEICNRGTRAEDGGNAGFVEEKRS